MNLIYSDRYVTKIETISKLSWYQRKNMPERENYSQEIIKDVERA